MAESRLRQWSIDAAMPLLPADPWSEAWPEVSSAGGAGEKESALESSSR